MKHLELYESFRIFEAEESETLWYQKCEGGDGIIDPSTFERIKLGNISAIRFINDDAKKYKYENPETKSPDNSESINNCLGGDPNTPLTGRFFETKSYDIGKGVKREYASFELDNTGKPV